VGTAVGVIVVGEAVGPEVGEMVGLTVGLAEGAEVGLPSSRIVTWARVEPSIQFTVIIKSVPVPAKSDFV